MAAMCVGLRDWGQGQTGGLSAFDSVVEYVFKESHVNITEKLLGETEQNNLHQEWWDFFKTQVELGTDVGNVYSM